MRLYLILFCFAFFCVNSNKANEVILYLAQLESQQSNSDLEQSLQALNHVFHAKYPQYPVIIVYEEENIFFLNSNLRDRFSTALKATVVSCDHIFHAFTKRMCFFALKNFRHVPWPFSLYQDVYKVSNPYYSRIGYRNMCRFWIKTLFEQSFMQNVSVYFRMDTDTFLEKMPGNPFEYMHSKGLAYLGSVMYKDSPNEVDGLWETFLRYSVTSGIHPGGLAPLSNSHADTLSFEQIQSMPASAALEVLKKRGYNRNFFYNNWEVSRVDLWQSEAYQKLAEEIDLAGGVFMRRWGDAPVRTLALFLLREYIVENTHVSNSAVFTQYQGLNYFHKSKHATSPQLDPIRPKPVYVYDRAVCTGLGDRVGALMTLATLASIHDIQIVFRWCGDPSEIFPRMHKHMPGWHGFNYSFREFQHRFWPGQLHVKLITPHLLSIHKQSPNKVIWEGLSDTPAEAGIDHVYTTAWKAVIVPGGMEINYESYKKAYKRIAKQVLQHTLMHNSEKIASGLKPKYIALHMRGPDDNTYNSFVGCHDNFELYCTKRVLKRILKTYPSVKIVVLTNNVTWTNALLNHPRIQIMENSSAYDDFALLLGSSAIVQHANYGWSSFSSNPSMIAGVPLITTFKQHLQHHRLGWFQKYGGIPEEFYDCSQTNQFIDKLKEVL